MANKLTLHRIAQLIAVLLIALALKVHYSTASVNGLRWILAPIAFLVELVTGSRFIFESYSGYMNSEHTFIIGAPCAGINFLITAFLMLAMRRLWKDREDNRAPSHTWRFIPVAAALAYFATIAANTVRISTALRLSGRFRDIDWLNGEQLHRVEGILIYFGFLLVLYLISERLNAGSPLGSHASLRAPRSGLLRTALFPLLIYYAMTLGVPLARGANRQSDFWEHLLFVLLTPLVFLLPIAGFRFCKRLFTQRAH